MRKASILVIEDEAKIRTLLRNVLESDGYDVIESQSGDGVIDLLASRPIALITLDIQLGRENGLDLARRIRRVSSVPIIMVTGQDDVIDRVVGLEIGADDYITKPFHVREVIARVRSVLRRTEGTPETHHDSDESERYLFDGLTAVPDRLEIIDREGNDSSLTSGDFKLLTVFLERPKRVLSRDQLMDLTGGQDWSPLDRTIDNQVARLRKKIERRPSEPGLIKTVRGVGYTLACDVEVVHPSGSSSKSA